MPSITSSTDDPVLRAKPADLADYAQSQTPSRAARRISTVLDSDWRPFVLHSRITHFRSVNVIQDYTLGRYFVSKRISRLFLHGVMNVLRSNTFGKPATARVPNVE